jgi:hypothetical protein
MHVIGIATDRTPPFGYVLFEGLGGDPHVPLVGHEAIIMGSPDTSAGNANSDLVSWIYTVVAVAPSGDPDYPVEVKLDYKAVPQPSSFSKMRDEMVFLDGTVPPFTVAYADSGGPLPAETADKIREWLGLDDDGFSP